MNLGYDIHDSSAPLRSRRHHREGTSGSRSGGPLGGSPRDDKAGKHGRRTDPTVSPHSLSLREGDAIGNNWPCGLSCTRSYLAGSSSALPVAISEL